MSTTLPPPRRILLIRLSAFGDVVIATGLLHGLKQAYPEAEIDWLVQPEFAGLLRTQPAIAQVQVWERRHWGQLLRSGSWLTLWRAMCGFVRTLRARHYDWVIDAQGLFKSRALARLAGGRFRIGYDGKEPGRFWLHQSVQRFPEAHPQRRYIGDEHTPMLTALAGAGEAIPHWHLPVPAAPTPYLVVAPFTTRPQKHWPEAHWIALLKALTAEGWTVRILGGPGDTAAAERLRAGCTSAALENCAGKTSLMAAAEFIAGARAVIGVDTGLTHLSLALHRPTVTLFGSTRPYSAARSSSSAVLFLRLPCAPCGRHPSCEGRWDCLTQLSPLHVQQAIKGVLREKPEATAAASTVRTLFYDQPINLDDSNDSHALMLRMIGEGHSVLEYGCATGRMSRVLQQMGCAVTGIEVDPTAAALARPYTETVEVIDLDHERASERLRDEAYDVIVFGDVLEHLRDPAAVLQDAVRLLAPDGRVVISLPNMAHADVRLALLAGSVPYGDCGLLDRTHLRWFTHDSLIELLASAGLEAFEWQRTVRAIGKTEVPYNQATVPEGLCDWLTQQPEATTYQFVVQARRTTQPSALAETLLSS